MSRSKYALMASGLCGLPGRTNDFLEDLASLRRDIDFIVLNGNIFGSVDLFSLEHKYQAFLKGQTSRIRIKKSRPLARQIRQISQQTGRHLEEIAIYSQNFNDFVVNICLISPQFAAVFQKSDHLPSRPVS